MSWVIYWDGWFQIRVGPDSRVEFDSSGVSSKWIEIPDLERDFFLEGVLLSSGVLELGGSVRWCGKDHETHETNG